MARPRTKVEESYRRTWLERFGHCTTWEEIIKASRDKPKVKKEEVERRVTVCAELMGWKNHRKKRKTS